MIWSVLFNKFGKLSRTQWFTYSHLTLWGTVTALCSEGPMFRRSYVQKVLCSEGPVFRRSYVQKVLCSESSIFRRFDVQKVLCSEIFVQKVLCLESTGDYTRRQINLYRMFFADFSVNSQPIFMQFCEEYFLSHTATTVKISLENIV